MFGPGDVLESPCHFFILVCGEREDEVDNVDAQGFRVRVVMIVSCTSATVSEDHADQSTGAHVVEIGVIEEQWFSCFCVAAVSKVVRKSG